MNEGVLPAWRGPIHRSARVHRRLAVAAACIAVSAYAGAIALSLGWLALEDSLNERLPFGSPVLGGVALALVVGAPFAVLTLCAASGDSRSERVAQVAGLILIGWIAIELAVIRELSPLHPFFAAVGLAFMLVGRHRH